MKLTFLLRGSAKVLERHVLTMTSEDSHIVKNYDETVALVFL